MPGRDGTGPMGYGPLTGRGLGRCAGAGAGFGRGYGRGSGYGLYCGRGFGRFMTEEQAKLIEKEMLMEEKELLQSRLGEIEKQLEKQSEEDGQSTK